jgi:flagellar basal-body rod protein FlgC
MQALEIGFSALDVEWRRLEVIAENLANANTARTAGGLPYQPRQLISGPRGDFAAYLDPAGADASAAQPRQLAGVMVYGIETMARPPRLVHEPGNPQADENGYVAYPGVDYAAEMALLLKTSRIYEANVVAMGAARQMYTKALELGRRS